jgi:DNA polymerase I
MELKSLETLLQTFIIPLIELTDKNGRIHCSINLNTETGRLSARKPNLLNQPALDKDIYKIRQAFTCEKGNKLIVADYGQLELRILAHMTQCKTMIRAFE